MSDTDTELDQCPVNTDNCPWLLELEKLRKENEELKLLVSSDPLTGLFNYRHFRQMLDTEMQRTIRNGQPTCLIMIDLDHFKLINDDWGHEAGNLALKTTAKVFKQETRPYDILCRYGGEEFAIILPETSLPIAVNVAERIRQCLENTSMLTNDGEFQVTASFGVEIYRQASRFTAELFIESADKLLFQAKEEGRNRVCHSEYTPRQTLTAVTADEKSALFHQPEPKS